MNFNFFIGQRIREIRKKQKLSQEKLASMSELDRTYMSSIERGERSISLKTAIKLSTALKIDLNKLIEREDGTYINGGDLTE